MKIAAEREKLLNVLQIVSRVASTRNVIQALSGVQFSAQTDACELRATDLDVSLRVPLPARVDQPGEIVVPARLLLDVVRALPGSEVSIQLRAAQQDVEVVSGRARFQIRLLRSEDFPPFPSLSGERTLTLPAAAFASTALTVAGSASRDETRPVLTGVLVSASDQSLRMVATDSYRLSLKETRLSAPVAHSFEVNIPARALQELARLMPAAEEDLLHLSLTGNQIVFGLGGLVLSSRLIEGQFPNYRQLLPETFEHELRIDGPELSEVVRRVSLLAQKNAPLALSFRPGELTVSAQTPDVGRAEESMPVPFQGDQFEIGFNPDYLREGIEAVAEGDLLLKLISPLRPGLIESADDRGFLYLIMPIRLNV